MDELLKHYARWKKPVTENYVLYNFIYMKYPEDVNLEVDDWLLRTRAGGNGTGGWWLKGVEFLPEGRRMFNIGCCFWWHISDYTKNHWFVHCK